MTLLKETLEELRLHNLTEKDVLWIGNKHFYTDWDNFADISDVEYDGGYGAQEVATDLLVVGKDWWLERHEYDGSEWWEFKKVPKQPQKKVILERVVGGMWETLIDLNIKNK